MPALRFVILRHEGIDDPHFDLMFETSCGSELKTFRSPIWPLEAGTELVALGDHRRAYLDYEGPISNNRGSVRRIASGTFVLQQHQPDMFAAQIDGKTLILRQNPNGGWFSA